MRRFLIIFIFLSISFTTSLPVLKYFDTSNSVDPKSYIKMSRGDFDVTSDHRYRFLIPKLVSLLKPYIQNIDLQILKNNKIINNYDHERLGFFLVNITISSITAYYTFIYLKNLGFDPINALLGGALFITNRYVILSNGAPLVDSLMYLCLILHSIFLLNKDSIRMSFLLPLMGITKETLIPLIIIPFFNNKMNKKIIFCSIIISIIFILITRNYIYSSSNEITISLYQNFLVHLNKFPKKIMLIFSLKGFIKIFSAYGVLLLFAILGYFENTKNKDLFFPRNIKLLVPYSIFLCFLSNDPGKVISYAYPVVIPYSLYFINKKIIRHPFIFK